MMMSNKEQIKFYEDRIAHLEEMLAQSMEMNKALKEHLAKSRYITDYERRQYPVPGVGYPIPDPYWKANSCPKCKISLTDTMCYTCVDQACPCGLGPVTCQT